MIDQFCIFELGGTVLWSRNFVEVKGDPISVLIRSVLLEDRLSVPELTIQNYTLRWTLDNQRGLIFVVIFQRQLPPPYATDLLQLVRDHFSRVEIPDANALDPSADFDHFSPTFDHLLDKAERRASNSANSALKSTTNRSAPTRKQKPKAEKQPVSNDAKTQNGTLEGGHDSDETTLSPEEVIKRNREAFLSRSRGGRRSGAGGASRGKAKSNAMDVKPTESAPRKKTMRPGNKKSEADVAVLDFSEGKPTDDVVDEEEMEKMRQQYIVSDRNTAYDDILNSDDEDEESDDDDSDDAAADSQAASGLVHFFKGLAGLRSLTRADLKPVMDQFRDDLIGKNVAQDIADKLIESVITSLEGKTMESMTSIKTMVRKALDEALTRILTPRQSTDILAEINARKRKGRPYVIAYCGVNGVGKSTSLAKTCFYLLNHGHKVMIAACDTFRAGAVEQLRTHVKCLGRGVELFDRGYGKDAAAVAADAIRRAKELNYDVVLVDTAGRMQDNKPLMRALSKLVEVNRPDRLFFVGEALVGNDAVDQLTKFNAALTDHQISGSPRLIDGIVLTKFDTIDDKVGAAVSMVYTTGQPIVFIGIGQTYMDLRKLNTRSLVKALLK